MTDRKRNALKRLLIWVELETFYRRTANTQLSELAIRESGIQKLFAQFVNQTRFLLNQLMRLMLGVVCYQKNEKLCQNKLNDRGIPKTLSLRFAETAQPLSYQEIIKFCGRFLLSAEKVSSFLSAIIQPVERWPFHSIISILFCRGRKKTQ